MSKSSVEATETEYHKHATMCTYASRPNTVWISPRGLSLSLVTYPRGRLPVGHL